MKQRTEKQQRESMKPKIDSFKKNQQIEKPKD